MKVYLIIYLPKIADILLNLFFMIFSKKIVKQSTLSFNENVQKLKSYTC